MQSQSLTYSGPIPPPEALREYEKTLPGAAERILAMAEKEQSHRHEITKSVVEREKRGQLMGLFLIVLLIGVALFLALSHLVWLAGIIFGTLIVALARIFVLNKNSQKE